MTKIKMITLYAGPKCVMQAGNSYDVDPALAKQLIEGHFAVKVSSEPVPTETTPAELTHAVIETEAVDNRELETAAKSAPRKGGKG